MKRVDNILDYWFGRVESTVVPTQNRNRIWFGGGDEVDLEIKEKFGHDLENAILGKCDHWDTESRSSLALIIVLDQFSRNIYRGSPMAFAQDDRALDLTVRGIERQFDHGLSLIERAFYYMPLMHSENIDMQNTSVRAFKMLVDLSFPEARAGFENFYHFAIKHLQVIEQFDRFPHRNGVLGRQTTPEEQAFLASGGAGF